MNKIISAIGRFFKGIWNWIKNTAWIQPLLIVGVIFGLIMSIRPITDWINQITQVETQSTFYDDHSVDYDTLESKIDATGSNENSVLIAIYIREENETCAMCVEAQKPLESFFSDDHSEFTENRNYEIAVLDIASDEFDEDEVSTPADLKDIGDHIEKYSLNYVWEYEMPVEFTGSNHENGTVDSSADDPLSTPAIMRYENGRCVGIMMGYDTDIYDQFNRFCYYDPDTDFLRP